MVDDGGLGKLQRRLAAIPAEIKAAVQPSLVKSAEEVAATMRLLVPVSTGDLRDSIEVTPGGASTPAYSQPGGSMTVPDNAAAVTAGNDGVRYAHLVEYGSTKAAAKPFFWPAVRLHQKKIGNRLKRAVAKAVREAGQ